MNVDLTVSPFGTRSAPVAGPITCKSVVGGAFTRAEFFFQPTSTPSDRTSFGVFVPAGPGSASAVLDSLRVPIGPYSPIARVRISVVVTDAAGAQSGAESPECYLRNEKAGVWGYPTMTFAPATIHQNERQTVTATVTNHDTGPVAPRTFRLDRVGPTTAISPRSLTVPIVTIPERTALTLKPGESGQLHMEVTPCVGKTANDLLVYVSLYEETSVLQDSFLIAAGTLMLTTLAPVKKK